MTGKKKIRQTAALAFGLAALLSLQAISGLGTAYGAAGIETDRDDCRVTFTLDVDELGEGNAADSDYTQYYGELSEVLEGDEVIVAQLYRVAEVDPGGHFTLLDDYQEGALEGIESADAAATAQQWADWAQAAALIAVGAAGNPEEVERIPDGEARIGRASDGSVRGTAENLKTGLYLVYMEPVETPGYLYRFIPYLIALPGYGYGEDSDQWNYGEEEENPVFVGLKPEREDRYGDLVIEKTLTSYNETLKGASFVFEIKAVKDQKLVYSDVVSLVFDGCGSDTVTVEKIPLGAQVTVTEIYSGAGYRETSTGSDPARQSIVMEVEGENRVSFVNEYDGRLNGGGASVVNHFSYGKDEDGIGRLDWEPLRNGNNDSRTVQEPR